MVANKTDKLSPVKTKPQTIISRFLWKSIFRLHSVCNFMWDSEAATPNMLQLHISNGSIAFRDTRNRFFGIFAMIARQFEKFGIYFNKASILNVWKTYQTKKKP